MHAGVPVTVALLLSEIPTLLEKEVEEKEIVWVQKWIRKGNQLCVSSMPRLTKQLALEDTESCKNHLGLYRSLVPVPLFFDFTILFSSWLYSFHHLNFPLNRNCS